MSASPAGASIIAVDTGGTFTDVVARVGGRVTVLKVPSTPDDPARAVLEGVRAVAGDAPFVLVHGSTVATNTLLEGTGARVALVTNAGFEDVIEIGRQNRPQLYALVGHRPPPLVSREDRHGIAGRLGPDGSQEEPLDDHELDRLADRIAGADSLAICLLHSYADPEHEERVAAALEAVGVPFSVSSRLLPEYREYERTATTVVNAYVAPRMDRYLGRVAADSGADRVRIMGSGGGALAVERARREAVHTVLSGPAGGVMGALRVAREAGIADIITFDMGGTSTDVSLCPGEPLHTREFSIAGLPVAVPVIDIHTVGAGGGSLAGVDAGGALRVGPRSAGADPGPVCYGRGGTGITVTDANVWLGRLPPEAFLGGGAELNRAAIEAPLRALADSLGTSMEDAAEGVIAVADTAMEGALRVISVERGHDPADFALVPFGGAAGLHAVELADRLGIPRLLVPPDPGVLSAYGMLVSPVRKDVARTVLIRSEQVVPDDDSADGAPAPAEDPVEAEFAALEARALEAMAEEGLEPGDVALRRLADARYAGQSFELRVPAEDWVQEFHAAHETRYGFRRPDAVVELVTARVEATGPEPEPGPSRGSGGPYDSVGSSVRGSGGAGARRAVRYRGEVVESAVVARDTLEAGATVEGPAVIHEYSATFWLPPRWVAEVGPRFGLSVRRR